jgi:YHS domain-containing protein
MHIMNIQSRKAALARFARLAVTGAGLALAPVPFGASAVFAFDEASPSALNLDGGLALRGYDPVAYFAAGQPTPGDAAFTAEHAGATYRFANAANRDAFLKEPAKYLPQYGGFCAMAAALEKKFDGDPNVWKIVDGKLYLNVNADVSKRWQEDIPGNVNKADGNWQKIKDKAPKEL